MPVIGPSGVAVKSEFHHSTVSPVSASTNFPCQSMLCESSTSGLLKMISERAPPPRTPSYETAPGLPLRTGPVCGVAGKGQPGAEFLCTDSYVRSVIKRLGIRAGILNRVPAHGLRHTHVFELMMEGVPIPTIQRQTGHSSLATIDVYLSPVAPKHAIDSIANLE